MKLDSSFEESLQRAVLDDVEQTVRAEIGPDLARVAEDNWRAYASRNGYDIDFVWEDADLSIERTDDAVTIRLEWPSLSALFEWGVDPHTIRGNPMLHFYWEEQDRWIQTEEVEWGSETGGIPESRAVRDALEWFRGELQ